MQKMDKSSSILRNHMIAQAKRMHMSPSELLFDTIYENRVLEVMSFYTPLILPAPGIA